MSTVRVFFLAMILHSEAQRRAQAEITAFLANEGAGDRALTLDDRLHLPYVDCVIKETIRLHPAAPLGKTNGIFMTRYAHFLSAVPHCSRDEDVYRGWIIPAQSIVIANIWYYSLMFIFPDGELIVHSPVSRQLTRDPALYPEPSAFKPERYLSPAEKCAPSGEPFIKNPNKRNPDPQEFAFGFGRRCVRAVLPTIRPLHWCCLTSSARECPGRHIASGLIWTTIANILASYNILPVRDKQGNFIPPAVKFTGGTLS